MTSRPLRLLATLGAALLLPPGARAASTVSIAAIGDAAPGGGQFAGPGFTGTPSAGGEGWVAFRSQVTGGNTSEAIVAARLTPPITSQQVATVGQAVTGTGDTELCSGTIRQLIGQPVVNARGDVAFLAVISPKTPRPKPREGEEPIIEPTTAGLYVWRDGRARPVACGGQKTPLGTLDLLLTIDPFADDIAALVERAPALNDQGQVAFAAAVLDEVGFPAMAAIFTAGPGRPLEAVVRTGDAFEGGQVETIGPPALNNLGTIVFHGSATTESLDDLDGFVDGIFASSGGALTALVRDGIAPPPGDRVFEFQDAVAVNDAGDVVFLAGPYLDIPDDPDVELVEEPGVLLYRQGAVSVVAYPGQDLEPDRISAFRLGAAAGGALVPPGLTADGRVVFLASLNRGAAEGVFVWSAAAGILPKVYTAGGFASDTPVGGVYAGARAAPAVDARGGIALVSRVSGGATVEALFFLPTAGDATPIVVGDAAPSNAGFLAGRPFGVPAMNDAGDVVFRAYLARGPSAVGIFRWREGVLTPVVRAGDPSPLAGNPPFVDLVGEPSLDATGRVAFAALVDGHGRGVFFADASGIHPVALRDGPAPGDVTGTTFASVGTNPSIDVRGGVAFRARTEALLPVLGVTLRRDGIFLADATGVRPLVMADDEAPDALPFLRLRDAVLTGVPSVAFRASLPTDPPSEIEKGGVFLADATGTRILAQEGEQLPGGDLVTGFSGSPAASPAGNVAFSVTRSRRDPQGFFVPAGSALVRRTRDGLEVVARAGDRVPSGGELRRIGQPAVNDAGDVAFRASFVRDTGGTGGLYVLGPEGARPAVLQRDGSPLGGRFASFSPRITLNARNEIAFAAGVTRARARTGLFAAFPTELRVQQLTLRAARRDRVRLVAELRLGRVNDGIVPGREPVTVWLNDTRGPLWSATLPARRLRKVGRTFVGRGDGAAGLRLALLPDGRVRVRAVSRPVAITNRGRRPLAPPFTVGVGVGNDGGSALVACPPDGAGVRCAPAS